MSDELRKKITEAINWCSAENDSSTPDFILGEFLVDCLEAFNIATQRREARAQPATVAPPVEAKATIAALEIDGESGRAKEVRWPSLVTRIRSLVITPYPNRDEAERSAIAFAVDELQRQNASLRTQLAEAERIAREHHLEACETCAACTGERDEALERLAEADALIRVDPDDQYDTLRMRDAYLNRHPEPSATKVIYYLSRYSEPIAATAVETPQSEFSAAAEKSRRSGDGVPE